MGPQHLRLNPQIHPIPADRKRSGSGGHVDRCQSDQAVDPSSNTDVMDKPHYGHLGFFGACHVGAH